MADTLRRQAVAYLNQDVAVGGRNFGSSGSASLHRLVYQTAGTVRQPGDTVSVYTAWSRRVVEGPEEDPRIGNLGGGSDFAGFYNHLGIPSFGFGFGGPYGVYHSAYDSYQYMTKFSDPGGLSHAAAGALVSVATARLANADVVPLDYQDYGRHLASVVEPVRDQAVALAWDVEPFEDLVGAVEALTLAGARFNEERDAALASGGVSPASLAEVNAGLRKVEQHMVRPEGLVGRPWMRNLIFASDRDNGYATIPLPSVSEAIRSEDEALMRREIEDLADRIRNAAAAVDGAREGLGREGNEG
jgi:N-acetylated-alpha-linked acidic dipeptidase